MAVSEEVVVLSLAPTQEMALLGGTQGTGPFLAPEGALGGDGSNKHFSQSGCPGVTSYTFSFQPNGRPRFLASGRPSKPSSKPHFPVVAAFFVSRDECAKD